MLSENGRVYPRDARGERPVLITGGAGFVGTNLAHRLLSGGRSVIVFDNLSRPGVDQNLKWLRETHGSHLRVEIGDVRDRKAVQRAVQQAEQVFHFAAQVAVTTSLNAPIEDFEINAGGTLNVLTAVTSMDNPPSLVFTSTNKVYGGLEDVKLVSDGRRYSPADRELSRRGVSEVRPLDFHSPYGCSKGAADQYVIDFARTYGIPAVVFRMSCIYGPHQFGTEDQGWVAHFLLRALRGQPIALYGDGMQVRDLLFVEDLVDAFLLAQEKMPEISGRAFNIGGGPANATSLMDVMRIIAGITGRHPAFSLESWRPGDQRYYVSDTSAFTRATGWKASVGVEEGLRSLHDWMAKERLSTPVLKVETARSSWRRSRIEEGIVAAAATAGEA